MRGMKVGWRVAKQGLRVGPCSAEVRGVGA